MFTLVFFLILALAAWTITTYIKNDNKKEEIETRVINILGGSKILFSAIKDLVQMLMQESVNIDESKNKPADTNVSLLNIQENEKENKAA